MSHTYQYLKIQAKLSICTNKHQSGKDYKININNKELGAFSPESLINQNVFCFAYLPILFADLCE